MSTRSPVTRWSLVLAAGRDATEVSRRALTRLCELYWYPIYAFVRRRGSSAGDAHRLTEAYFGRLLEKGCMDDVATQTGAFRSFLFASVSRFLAEPARGEVGGPTVGAAPISLDITSAEERYRAEALDELPPRKVFEKQWALALLDRALARLQEENAAGDAAEIFQRLRPHLSAGEPPGLPAMAAEMGFTEAALRQILRRLQKRFGELLREEIRETVANTATVERELRHLLTALAD